MRAAGEQLVGEADRGRELAELLDQELDPVQVGGGELAVGQDGAVELDQRLVDAAIVPEDLAAAVVGFGAIGMDAQRLVEPGERLFDAPAMRRLHRLVQAIPVAILVFAHPLGTRACRSLESTGHSARHSRPRLRRMGARKNAA